MVAILQHAQLLAGGGSLVAAKGRSSSVSLATSRCHSIGLGGRVPGCPDAMRNALCVGVRHAVLEVGVPRGVPPIGWGGVVGRGQPESNANAANGLDAPGTPENRSVPQVLRFLYRVE